MTAVVFAFSKPRFHLEYVWIKAGCPRGLTFTLDVCKRVCLVRRVPFALAWSPAVLQRAVRAEGGSREAEDNPVRAQGRQRKWLDIPDGGHSQENSCEGLNYTTSVWNSRLLPFSPSLLLSIFLLPASASFLALSASYKLKTLLSTHRWAFWLILNFSLFSNPFIFRQ